MSDSSARSTDQGQGSESYREPSRRLRVRQFDVLVAGAGTAGVAAALAAARQGAKTVLIEAKGYTGGTVVEGGTALHSFFNQNDGLPGVELRQVVKGIPQEIVDRLADIGGTTGFARMTVNDGYDPVCTVVDTELYKLVTMQMLERAGVNVLLNTRLTGGVRESSRVRYAITESRSGREAFSARSFVDCTAYGDLAAFAGAGYSEPNDYAAANSIGIMNVDIDKYCEFFRSHGALTQLAAGLRSGNDGRVVRVHSDEYADKSRMPKDFLQAAREIGMAFATTTCYDNYLMFMRVAYRLKEKPTNRDAVAKAELELRRRQYQTVQILRDFVPGCEKAFIARTSPSLNIRRGRCIRCDYDIALDDVVKARHFDDDVLVYGFHDSEPRLRVANGGTYGIPFRALRPAGIDNLLVAGMMITSNRDAHMSTRNTVSCMGQGQAAGTAAALCAAKSVGTRQLPYRELRKALEKAAVYFES